MLRLECVSKEYDGVQALADVSLKVPAGTTTALVGSSGSGKSTALRMFNGLVAPDAGRVWFDRAPLQEHDIQRVRHRTGYVIQGGGLFSHLTAQANVSLLARHLGRPEAQIEERIAVLLELVRLGDDILRRYPTELSGGQQQRVALMRALMLQPEVLLLDEPLGALDPIVRAELQEDLSRIFEHLGTTVALVTHDLAEAARFGHSIALFHEGRVLQVGSLEDLTDAPADPLVERFVTAQYRMVERLVPRR